jgi:hypothetical protein
MKELEFRTTIEDVIRLFGPEGIIYSMDHSVFLRELIQNAMDSIEIFKEQEKPESANGHILISCKDRKITIEDNGWGLDRDGVIEHFARPLRGIHRYAESGARGMDKIIGHFGVGFLSVFKVSDYVEIETRRKGCNGISVNIGIKRDFVRGKNNLKLESFISETQCAIEHGMRVSIYLGSAESDTQRRSELIDSDAAVLKSLNAYILHPPADIDILFQDSLGIRTRIAAVPFKGEDMPVNHRINIEGIEGALAYSIGLDKPIFTVCQRGLLVKENYPTLLPDSTGAIIGEIDLLRTDIVDLSLSRESFLENEKFEKLKSVLAAELHEFDIRFKDIMERKFAEATKNAPKKNIVREDSQAATTFLEMYNRGIQKNIYYHKICGEVAFCLENEDTHLSLDEIVERARAKNIPSIHIHEQDNKYLYKFTVFDGIDYYKDKRFLAPEIEYLRQQGAMIICLSKREEGANLSFKGIVEEYLSKAGLGVIEIESGRIIPPGDDFPLKIDNSTVTIIDIARASGKRAYTHKYAFYSPPAIFLNRANQETSEIIECAKNITSETMRQLVMAWCHMVGGEFNTAARIIHSLILKEKLPEEPIDPALIDELIAQLKHNTEKLKTNLPQLKKELENGTSANKPDDKPGDTGHEHIPDDFDPSSLSATPVPPHVIQMLMKWFKKKRE